jgi:chemosensory pili system protein ChpA (sensor histidine kinase/response regulator)
MRLQDHIDFTTLQWVKPELDETLALAREALEAYVDNPGNRDVMRSCADSLHQVQGTLRMVELYGAAMVAEEMETLAISLLEDHVAQREDAYAALMRGLMQLPDYLERLSSGHRDVPVVLLPLLNDLRSSRGQQALHESALFSPNLEAPLPPEAPGAASKEIADHKRGEIAELRVRFQQQLLAWFRGQSEGGLAGMRQMLDAISARCYSIPGRRLWWIASGVLEGLQQGVLKQQATEVRQLIGKVDRSIRQLIEQGEGHMRGGDADELARKLLYVVAQSKQRTPQMSLLAKTYALDALLPDANELEHARGSMSGHNRALLDSVSRALKDDLLRVKEALDLFLRQANADPAQLSGQIDILERVGDTLGMLALGVPRRVVNEQRRVLDEIANRMRTPDEEILLDVAGALLYVEASLDDHIESLGAEDEQASDSNTAMLPRSEARHILATLMHEAIANTSKVKDSIVAFVESGWQHQELSESSPLMDEVAGALRMLSAPRPAELAEGIGRFIGNELLSDRRVPSSVQMDHLADALAALEYYLEAAREHRGGLEHILDVAEHSLSKLGYWPPPAARAPVEEAPLDLAATSVATTLDFSEQPELSETVSLADGVDPTRLFIGTQEPLTSIQHDIAGLRLTDTEHLGTVDAPAQDDGDWMEIEEEIFEQVPVSGALAFNAGFQASTEGIDDEIREIFLEEMQEEIDNLYTAQKQWLADVTQRDALTSIRRSFHTLKGSGRLVGASLLGEFGWKVENMLNRVLDASIEPHEGVQDLVHHAIDALPQLLQALKDDQQPTAPLAAIMETADRLANGQEHARIADFVAGPTETVRRVVRRRVPRLDAAADAVPVAALAEVEHTPTEAAFEPVPDAYAAPVLPPVDPVLLEILRSEVAQYLQTIRNTINRVDGEIKVDDGLLRAVHTLHGAIAMVDIPLLTQLLSPLESLLKRLRAAGQPLSIEGVGLLARSADAVDYVMGQFDAPNPQLPDLEGLIARLTDLRDSQPEPQVAHVLFEPQEDELDRHEAGAHETAAPAEPPAAAPTPEDEHHNAYAAELLAALDAFELDAANEAELDAPTPIVKTGHGNEEDDFAALFGDLIDDDAIDLDATEPSADGAHAPAHVEAGDVESFAVAPVEIEPVLTDIPVDAEAVDNVTHTYVPEVIQDISELPLIEEESALTDSSELVSLHEALQNAEPDLSTEHRAEHRDEPETEAMPVIDAGADDELLREIEAAEAELAAAATHELPALETPVEIVAEPVEAPHLEPAVEALAHVAEPALVEEPVEELHANESNAAMVYGQIDPDLLEIFIEEGREILDHADGVLAQWRAEPSELEHVASLQRDLHTLKGGARIAGMLAVGDLTHAIETLLERPVSQNTLQAGELISALEGGFDQLHLLVQRVSQGRPIEYPQAMIDRFLELSGETSVEEAVPPPAVAPLRVDLPELLPEEGQDEESRGPQEQIRVRAELLDSLVNHAGEVAIYRSRLEQQVAGYRFNLVELDQTVQRLRSQLRMLEIETEAQIIARFQREHREAGLSVFDPLELDRYSQLQQYSRALAESVSDLVSIQNMLDELTRQAETLLIQQSRVSSELQDGLLRTRMLPFDTMVPNLRRTLRQAAQEQGKGAQLYVEGAHGEMDRNLLDRIKAPFEHMLRNAVAHGIETPEDRRKAGKPEEGAVRIRVAREATEVVVRVTDDGRGLDREAIRKRGVERGLLRAESNPSDDQILQLITQTGFSTASEVTQLAGRGVGMDVVANEIKQLGGSLAIDSQQGHGTTFVLRLPFTLAVTQAILVRIGESNFAIPMTSVQGVARITPAELAARMAEPNPSFEYGGEQYGIHDLSELLGLVPNHALDEVQLPLLLTRAGDLRAAIRIDAVIGSREIVVKSVGPQVSSVPGILGATIMGDGSVLVILDLAPLVRHGIVRREQRLSEGLSAVQTPVVEEIRAKPLIMVVDDSITMRKVTGRVLERHEFEVSTAKDGVDAVEKLHDRVPDLMLLDIEMPRMDGYELATHMKADPRLRNVPIIMITSRTGDKHRQRAFDIGVDRYLGKPYQEAELLMQINEVLEQRAMAAVESIDE